MVKRITKQESDIELYKKIVNKNERDYKKMVELKDQEYKVVSDDNVSLLAQLNTLREKHE